MAEIILPPEEEQEETPQEPELNIDKPTENSKVITIEFEAKKTNKVSAKDTNQQLYTTDTDAWFEFKETSLESANGTYSVVFRNRHDGSIFQRTGDVVDGVVYYKIPHQEIRHAGAWRGQLVYTLENGNTTAREFGYDVKGHILDGKDVREIVVEDFETLMSQLNSMKDNAEQELADLVNTAGRNELERQQFYESLVEDINDLQENYQELLDTGVLQTNINEKLEQLEEEYAPKLTEVTAQLAQTKKYPFSTKQIQTTSFKPKPIVVFTFDDAPTEDLEVIKPMFDEFGYKGTIYAIPGYSGTRRVSSEYTIDYMTKDQLTEMYDDGWEIGAHTMNHIPLAQQNEHTINYEMKESKKVLESWGFEVTNFAYPFGSVNDVAKRISLKYFRSSTLFNRLTNSVTPPINKPGLSRISLGSFFAPETSDFPVTNTFDDYYKHWVDDAKENNRLTIFALHSFAMDEEQLGYLHDTLAYCKSLGIDVMTLDEALNYYDNILDLKTYNEDSTVKSEVLIDANGEVVSDAMVFTNKIQGEEKKDYSQSTRPEKYPDGMSYMALNADLDWDVYDNLAFVYTDKAFLWSDTVRQWVFQKWGTGVMYRSATREGNWTDFKILEMSSLNKFSLSIYMPLNGQPRDLSPGEQVVFTLPNSNQVLHTETVHCSTINPLPKGVNFYTYNSGAGTGVKLVLENVSSDPVSLAGNIAFNVKVV